MLKPGNALNGRQRTSSSLTKVSQLLIRSILDKLSQNGAMRELYRVEAEQLYPQPEINGIPLAFLPVSARLNPSALALLGRTRHPTDGRI